MNIKNIVIAALAALSIAACDDAATTTDMTVKRDLATAPPADMAQAINTGPDMGCYGAPSANSPYVQIINACTTDTRTALDKPSKPPLLNKDGTLPPLP